MFEHDIEKVLKDAAGTEFDALATKAAKELRYEGSSDLMKNTEGAARLVDLIYEAGKTIPVVEEIVKKITALCIPTAKSAGPVVETKEAVAVVAE